MRLCQHDLDARISALRHARQALIDAVRPNVRKGVDDQGIHGVLGSLELEHNSSCLSCHVNVWGLRCGNANDRGRMRVLVTGGGGYIGRELTKALAARGDKVTVFDAGIPPQIQKLAEGSAQIKLIEGDITDLAGLVSACQTEKPDAIAHCAAVVGVIFSVSSPSNVVRVNV